MNDKPQSKVAAVFYVQVTRVSKTGQNEGLCIEQEQIAQQSRGSDRALGAE